MKIHTAFYSTRSLPTGRGSRLLAASAAIILGLAGQIVPAQAEEIRGDQYYVGDTTIAEGDTVKGDVFLTGGILRVLGTVKGNITVEGGIEVGNFTTPGLVKGDIRHHAQDGVFSLLAVNPGSEVMGRIESTDALFVAFFQSVVMGDVFVEGSSLTVFGALVKGGLVQEGDGDIRVQGSFGIFLGEVHGDIYENGNGSVTLLGGLINGDVVEEDFGDLNLFSGVVNGDVSEDGAGTVVIFSAEVNGEIDED